MPGLLLRRSKSHTPPSANTNTSTYSSLSKYASPLPTIHYRRAVSRASTSSSFPSILPSLGLSSSFPPNRNHDDNQGFTHDTPLKRERHSRIPFMWTDEGDGMDSSLGLMSREGESESDAECWLRMLALQREYHCYNSARLEAAVEALDRGWSIDEVPVPSRLCLDLLNEGLRAQLLAAGRGTRRTKGT